MPSQPLRRVLGAAIGTVLFATLGGAQALAVDGVELASLPRDPAPAGLDVRLDDVADAFRARGLASAVGTARAASLEVAGDRVEVVVEAERGRAAAAQAALAARGAVVERSYGELTRALVPVAALTALARADGVRSVEPPRRAHATALTGQGVDVSNASIAHAAGDKGAGVKIGIVDVGFDGYDDLQAQGELPATVATRNLCDGGFDRDAHGTAVAEIVHDVAPDAELHLICVEDVVDLGVAQDYALANGIGILNLSAGFYNTSRGDGSGGPGTPDAIVEAGRNAGILWIVAAGNEGESHWSGSFSGGGNTFNDFGPGDEGIDFTLPPSRTACVYLRWDAWPTTTTQDFDLGIFDASTLTLVAASAGDQVASNSSPTEEACLTAPPEGGEYFVAVERYAGTAPRLDIFVDGARLDQYRVAAGSLIEPASAPEALATAAVCWNGGLEAYSSQGPTIDGRVKPDLAGFDSTSSTVYGNFEPALGCGGSGFTGTSAAAPHVAGVAAIIAQQSGPLTPAQLQARLEATAQDLGTAGKDSLFGWGRLRLPAAPEATTAAAQAVGRRIVTLRGFVTANRWPGTYRWEYSTDPAFATSSTTASTPFAAADTVASASFVLEGLEPTTLYYARFVAENEHGSETGQRVSFTTADTAAPYVAAGAPTGLTSAGVTLNGLVNPNGLDTTYRFSYGASFPPATLAAEATLSGDDSEPVSVTLGGLSAGRTYGYRLEATNAAGTTRVDGTFATLAAPPAPPAPTPAPPTGGGGGSGGGAGPDLGILIGHGPALVAAGDTLTYAFAIRNKAGAKASNPAFSFTLPEALELVSTYAEKGPGCRVTSGRTSLCPLDFLDGSDTTRVTATVRVRENGTLTTTASVSLSETDLDPTDNQASYTITAGTSPAAQPPAADPRVRVIPPNGVTKTGSPSGDTMYGAGGRDTLRGLGGPDRLFGRAGNDRLLGGAGNDRLDGGPGRDLLEAGPGNDVVVARDRAVDVIRCGQGRDTVIADRVDRVARDCERVRRR